jgi:hypothetical protein
MMLISLGWGLARLPGLLFWADLSRGLHEPAAIGGVKLAGAPLSIVYVEAAGELYYEPAEGSPNLWVGRDGGRSWQPVELSAVRGILEEAREQDKLIKFVRDLAWVGNQIYFATDLGIYVLLPTGNVSPLPTFENEKVKALHVRNNTLYARTPAGLWALPLGDDAGDPARWTPLEDRYPRYVLQEAEALGTFVLSLGLFLLGFDLMLLRPSGLGWRAAPGVVRTGAWRPLLAGEDFRAYRERVALPLRSPLEALLLLGAGAVVLRLVKLRRHRSAHRSGCCEEREEEPSGEPTAGRTSRFSIIHSTQPMENR